MIIVSFFHFDEFRAREEEPGEKAAHEGAVEEVERETDFAKPEEVFVAQGAAHVGGEGRGEDEELGADCGPEAAEFGVLGGDFVEPLEEELAPGGPGVEFGGEGH